VLRNAAVRKELSYTFDKEEMFHSRLPEPLLFNLHCCMRGIDPGNTRAHVTNNKLNKLLLEIQEGGEGANQNTLQELTN